MVEHGLGNLGHVVRAVYSRSGPEADQLMNGQVVRSKRTWWPHECDIPLVAYPDWAIVIVDHDKVLMVLAAQSPLGAEQRRMGIDNGGMTEHHLRGRRQLRRIVRLVSRPRT